MAECEYGMAEDCTGRATECAQCLWVCKACADILEDRDQKEDPDDTA